MRGLIAVIVVSSVFLLSGQVNAKPTAPNKPSGKYYPGSPECAEIMGCFPNGEKPTGKMGQSAHPKKKAKKKVVNPPCQPCPQGAKGEKGDPGEKGEKGDKGDVGPQGPKGDRADDQHQRGPVRFGFGAMGNVMWHKDMTSAALGPALQLQIDLTNVDELAISAEYGPMLDGAAIGEIDYTRYLAGSKERPWFGLGVGAYFSVAALSLSDTSGYYVGVVPQIVFRPDLEWGQLRIAVGPYLGAAIYSFDSAKDITLYGAKDTDFSIGVTGSIILSIF